MRRPLWSVVALVLGLGVAGCSGNDQADGPVVVESSSTPDGTTPNDSEPPEQTPSVDPGAPPVPTVAGTIATGLTSPWGLVFLPNGDALVSERDTALVKRVSPDGEVAVVGEVAGVDTETTSEGGLLGIALHPDYPVEPFLYAYFTAADDNRIVRMPYQRDRLGGAEVLLDGIPKAENHNGGRIAFGPDGMLYVTTGDATEGGNAPDPSSLGGKLLRVTPEGDPAAGNPDPGSPVWSLGHRNPQGIAWDGELMWAAEFGQDTWDEINIIEAGSDYGWPECEGQCNTPGVVDPKVQWGTDEASPSGITYAEGAVWMAGLGGERLWRIVTDGADVVGEPQAFFAGEYGRVRTVEVAPDGSLWLTTSNTDGRGDVRDGDDRILRLTLER